MECTNFLCASNKKQRCLIYNENGIKECETYKKWSYNTILTEIAVNNDCNNSVIARTIMLEGSVVCQRCNGKKVLVLTGAFDLD